MPKISKENVTHNAQQLHAMHNTRAQLCTTNLHNAKHNTWFICIVKVCCGIVHLCTIVHFMYKTCTKKLCIVERKKTFLLKCTISQCGALGEYCAKHNCELCPRVLSIAHIYVVQHVNCVIVHYFEQFVPTLIPVKPGLEPLLFK